MHVLYKPNLESSALASLDLSSDKNKWIMKDGDWRVREKLFGPIPRKEPV